MKSAVGSINSIDGSTTGLAHRTQLNPTSDTAPDQRGLPARPQFTINLSDYVLNQHETNILDKGLTFIPTYNRLQIDDVYALQYRLIRSLKLKDYFKDADHDDGNFEYNAKRFVNNSTWVPPDYKLSSTTLNTIQKVITSTERVLSSRRPADAASIFLHRRRPNLTCEERSALSKLSSNKEIVIKPADKGAATVVMNKTHYIAEAHRQLRDQRYYKPLMSPVWPDNARRIDEILERLLMQQHIDVAQYKFLKPSSDSRPRRFYLLPKIHKDKAKWTVPDKMPEGRPVCSDCGSESYNVSSFVDSFLKPLSKRHPSYIKDTFDFVSKIRGHPLRPGILLVTGDVTSLYPNMRIDRIMSTTKDLLRRFPDQNRPDDELLELLDITLRGNDLVFAGEIFLQVCGTAMGKAYAPSLADIYLEQFDSAAMNDFRIKPELFYRFIDDVFFLWPGTVEDLMDFNNFLDAVIDGIKINLSWSTISENFLDTTVYKLVDNGHEVLATRLYFKPTDTHQLLHVSSFHPRHTCRGVLKSQFIRFRRICTTREDFNIACKVLMDALAVRGYDRRLMRRVKATVWNTPSDRPPAQEMDKRQILPIVVPYNDVGTQLVNLWREAINSDNTFADFRLVSAYTVGKNLSKRLVRSTLLGSDHIEPNTDAAIDTDEATAVGLGLPVVTAVPPAAPGSSRCLGPRCLTCQHIITSTTFQSHTNGRRHATRGSIRCDTTNVVYLITCAACGMQYVGETSGSLRDRLTQHRSTINTKKNTPVALHFNLPDHSASDLRVQGILSCGGKNCLKYRRLMEHTWIDTLQTAHPLGINLLKRRHLQS